MSENLGGMGAIVTPDGVAFRVWAPNAASVSVKGEFNDWSDDANPLGTEFNGFWYTFVPGMTVGQEYKFHLTYDGHEFDRMDPYAREVTNSVGNCVVHDHSSYDWEDDDFVCPPHNELVIYETHVGSFTSEEGVGTFEGLTGNLDHLQELGINAVQLMPVAEFAGDYSWGYNPAHIFAVESAYGGPDGLKNLVKECHRRGMAVIMDVVYNHLGPSDLSLWTFDGWSQDGYGGIFFYNDERAHTPWGATRPNYETGEVRQFLYDNALSWLRDFHCDGLRYDMIPFVRSVSGNGFDLPEGWSLMRWINLAVREEFPGAITIAEDMHGHANVVSTADDGAAFHAQWDALFVHPVREQLETPDDGERSVVELRDAIGSGYGDTFTRVIYTESHDEVANGRARVPEEIEPDNATGWAAQKRSTLGAGIVLTSPGIPMLFQGQEFLEGGWFRDDVPLDWSRAEDFRGIAKLYRDLIRLRRNWFDTTKGLTGHGLNVFHCNEDAAMIAWQRWADHGAGDDVVMVANLSHQARDNYRIGFPSYGLWKLRFSSDARIYSALFGDHDSFDADATGTGQDGMEFSAEVSIAPYSLLVFSQDS